MNDSEFEEQLRALAPAAPSANLAERIGRQLATAQASAPASGVIARPTRARNAFNWLRDLGWAGAGATVALAGIMIFSLMPKQGSAPVAPVTAPTTAVVAPAENLRIAKTEPAIEEQAFEPTETSRELIAVNDSNELIETADGPVREVRYTYLERLAWSHPGTGARLEIEVPREDVYLMPVSLQ